MSKTTILILTKSGPKRQITESPQNENRPIYAVIALAMLFDYNKTERVIWGVVKKKERSIRN